MINYTISLCCGILCLFQSLTSTAATYTVTNTADTGAGSFRNALVAAVNGDVIRFTIGGAAPHIISLASAINITQSNLTIDASTQTDFSCGNPTVIIDLVPAWPRTFTVQGTGNTIRGLSFQNVYFNFTGGGSHRLEGCWFNLNATGTAVAGDNQGANLLAFTNSTGNIIGGTTCATRNVFSMGGVTATYQGAFKLNSGCNNNQIIGNYFGTDKTGMNLLNQNSDHIIVIDNSTGITLDQNLISGARPAGAGGGFGIYTSGTSSSNLTITNNKIGVRLDGTDGGASWGNAYGGVALESVTCNNFTFNNNVVCRNGLVVGADIQKCGLYVLSACATVNIRNNFIGVSSTFQKAGNYFTGIFINGICSAVTIDNNVIGDNGETLTDGDESHGLSLEKPCTNVSITNNYIGTNAAGANLGNYCSGITISGGSNYTITGNRIGFNKGSRPAIPNACIVFTSTTDAVVQGNTLGGFLAGGPAGQNNLGLNIDGGAGVFISGTSSRIRIGGMSAGQQNIISYNRSHAIEVQNGDFIEMKWNSMYCNGLKGIQLNYGTAQAANNNFGSSNTLTITTPIAVPPSSLSGNRPANSVVDVFGTFTCASSASCIAQSESRFSATYAPAASGTAGTTWSYNNGALMYNDLSALATGGGTDCNAGYCRTSEFSPCIDNVLPVIWVNFKAKLEQERDVVLRWSTSEEINTLRYVIERSVNGVDFEPIATVKASGHADSYLYKDNDVSAGTYYYRLREEDWDGKYEYSSLETISVNQALSVSVSPNPNNGYFTVQVNGFEEQVSIRVHDMLGALVYDKENSKERTIAVQLNTLSVGMYILSVTGGNTSVVQKIIVE